MFSKVKNFLIAFSISIVVFGMVALFVVDLLVKCIGGAFTLGNIGNQNNDPNVDPEIPEITVTSGNSLYFLAVVSDYRPSFYGDYDFEYIRSKFGPVRTNAFPSDLNPIPSTVINLPSKPLAGTLDPTSPTTNIIGGLQSDNLRIINTDTIVLVRMDKERRQFTFTYFPSNSYIEYGGEALLLRELYYYHGMDALINVVHSITGIRPDRHVLLHAEYVDDVVNYMDGIDLVMPLSVKIKDVANDMDINIVSGLNSIDGRTAQQLLLYNAYKETDDFSIERAGLMMVRSIIAKLTQPGGYQNAGVKFTEIRKYCVTDMLIGDITGNRDIWYAYTTFGKQQVDIKGRYITEMGQRVFSVDVDRTISAFANYRKIYE